MSTEQSPKQATNTPPRFSLEEWVERVATYWGRAAADAWRTVFPRREDTK